MIAQTEIHSIQIEGYKAEKRRSDIAYLNTQILTKKRPTTRTYHQKQDFTQVPPRGRGLYPVILFVRIVHVRKEYDWGNSSGGDAHCAAPIAVETRM